MLLETPKRWLLPAFVLVGIVFVLFAGSKPMVPTKALAEVPIQEGGSIVVVPVQIDRDSYGVVMVDKANETIWVYEINSRGPAQNRLRLLAARSWQYDRQLQEYNTGEPKPEQIRLLLEAYRRRQKELNKQQRPEIEILEIAEPNKNGAEN